MRVVLIPMKPLSGAKERLAPALSPDERRALSLAMLSDVIAAAKDFERVWVLNSDADATALATSAGVEAVEDPAPGQGLNPSLASATSLAIEAGATGVLIVSADLPAVTASDLEALSAAGGVSLAPDRGGAGTNALWRSPGDVMGVAFGPNSLAGHATLAWDAGVGALVVERPGLALDVDTPEDLAAAFAYGVGATTRRALEDLDLANRLRLAG
jgi:2-phospho-L-lactate/phosphoenolpyruvate guanylyltransferase